MNARCVVYSEKSSCRGTSQTRSETVVALCGQFLWHFLIWQSLNDGQIIRQHLFEHCCRHIQSERIFFQHDTLLSSSLAGGNVSPYGTFLLSYFSVTVLCALENTNGK